MACTREKSQGQGHSRVSLQPHKPFFCEDEKVLCYEPDQKKAQVLYDSKVLEVVEKKEAHGKSHFEYKIHFQGWNSSWDRYVREDNVLKDTNENRDLQRRLNEEAQLLNKNALKKKNKKKTLIEKLKAAMVQSKDGNSPCNNSRGESNQQSSGTDKDNTDEDSSDDEDVSKVRVQIIMPEALKYVLEDDYFRVKRKNMLVRLPSRYSVVDILESYIVYVGRQELNAYTERRKTLLNATTKKTSTAGNSLTPSTLGGKLTASTVSKTPGLPRTKADIANEELLKSFQRINLTKKIVDDTRIMFDFLLRQILLYEHENSQYVDFMQNPCFSHSMWYSFMLGNVFQSVIKLAFINNQYFHFDRIGVERVKDDAIPVRPTAEVETNVEPPNKKRKQDSTSDAVVSHDDEDNSEEKNNMSSSSNVVTPKLINQTKHPSFECKLHANCEYPWACEQLNKYLDELSNFQLLPRTTEYVEVHPSLSYGMIHLLRLFVKMPEILSKTSISTKKLRSIVLQINKLLQFLSKYGSVLKSDWFNPDIKLYEEDYFEATNYKLDNEELEMVIKTEPSSISKRRKGPTTNEPKSHQSPTPASANVKDSKSEKSSTNELTPDSTLQTQPFMKLEANRVIERPVKRSQRKSVATRSSDSLIDANTLALGVRKSLSIEELSRETLVAANNPTTECKSYSLRMHCRVPYRS